MKSEEWRRPGGIKAKTFENHFPKVSAVRTRLELVTSCVTGRHSNQLNYRTIIMEEYLKKVGGAYETRTRDLLRDRQAF